MSEDIELRKSYLRVMIEMVRVEIIDGEVSIEDTRALLERDYLSGGDPYHPDRLGLIQDLETFERGQVQMREWLVYYENCLRQLGG